MADSAAAAMTRSGIGDRCGIDPGLVADVCPEHGIQVLGSPPSPLD
jgi:hypothetical protein